MPDVLVAVPRPPRTPRNWWKVWWYWLLGCITDPHRHTTSSARIISFAMTYTLHVYVTHTKDPNPAIVGILVTGGILPLVFRTKSTQRPELLLPRPPIVVSTPEATHE